MTDKEAQLQGEVDELLRRAQEVDEEEDHRYGRDKRGDELPADLSLRFCHDGFSSVECVTVVP